MCATCDICKGNVNKLLFIFMQQMIVLWLVGCISWLHVIIFQSAQSHISFSIYLIHNVAMRGLSHFGENSTSYSYQALMRIPHQLQTPLAIKSTGMYPVLVTFQTCQSNIMTLESLLSVTVTPGSCFIMQLKHSSCVSHHLKDKHTYIIWKNRRH